jgi:hypothetical protein
MRKILASLLLAATPACGFANTITYDFTVNGGLSGPLAGVTSTGYFSYDDSIVPVGGGMLGSTGLFTDLSLDWMGAQWDETSANTGWLGFDADSTLMRWGFGNYCGNGSCGVESDVPTWFVHGQTSPNDPPLRAFTYSLEGSVYDSTYNITLRTAETTTVPEPSTLVLMGTGAFGLALLWRRRRSLTPQRSHSAAIVAA